jgi:ArsR family transcriptional regulator
MKTTNRDGFEDLIYEKQVGICKAFANPTRLRMLDLIALGTSAAADLQKQLGISKANLSQHMVVLKAAGVIATHREGKKVYCQLAIPEIKQACEMIRGVLRAQIRKGRQLVA